MATTRDELYIVNDLKKAIAFYIKNRNALKTDVVINGEMELLMSLYLRGCLKSSQVGSETF